MGGVFVVVMLRSVVELAATYNWRRATCQIISSSGDVDLNVDQDRPPYQFRVSYRYEWGGRQYTANAVSLRPRRFSDWSQVTRRLREYAPGSLTACYVDGSLPSRAILERDQPWVLLFLPIPLLFVFIGAGGIYGVWFWSKGRAGVESISSRARKAGRGWAAVLLSAVFALAGAGIFLGVFLRPAKRVLEGPAWREGECIVEFSRVGRHAGDESTTYSVDVLYSYRFDGVEYRSSRYGLFDAASSGYSSKAAVIRRLPRGARTACYVNPRNPEEAVIDRGFPLLILTGLIPLLFTLLGVMGLTRSLPRALRGRLEAGAHPLAPGPVTVRPQVGRGARLAGCAFVTLFWNGVVSVFVWQVIDEWGHGRQPWISALFLVPFVLVGVAGVAGFGYTLLGVFAPKPSLRLTPGEVPLGGSATLEWEIPRGASTIRRLRVFVEAREEVTFSDGDSTGAARHVFAHFDLADLSEPADLSRGTASLTIPPDVMHSFDAPHNKVTWAIHVKGELRLWPDINEEFVFQVRA